MIETSTSALSRETSTPSRTCSGGTRRRSTAGSTGSSAATPRRHGALLAVLLPLAGAGLAVTVGLELPDITIEHVAAGWPVVVVLYFLAWKFLVGFLNELLGVHA